MSEVDGDDDVVDSVEWTVVSFTVDKHKDGVQIDITQSNVHESRVPFYTQLWNERYFNNMEKYFSSDTFQCTYPIIFNDNAHLIISTCLSA